MCLRRELLRDMISYPLTLSSLVLTIDELFPVVKSRASYLDALRNSLRRLRRINGVTWGHCRVPSAGAARRCTGAERDHYNDPNHLYFCWRHAGVIEPFGTREIAIRQRANRGQSGDQTPTAWRCRDVRGPELDGTARRRRPLLFERFVDPGLIM